MAVATLRPAGAQLIERRILASTVRVALVHPSFSNRSTGTLVGGAVGAAIGLGLSMAQVRRSRQTAPASESR